MSKDGNTQKEEVLKMGRRDTAVEHSVRIQVSYMAADFSCFVKNSQIVTEKTYECNIAEIRND